MNKTLFIGLIAPPNLLPEVDNISAFIRKIISRNALNDFNETAYKAAKAVDALELKRTTIAVNKTIIKGIDAYKEKHGLTSRNQAVMAILATYHAKQPVIETKTVIHYQALRMMNTDAGRKSLSEMRG